MWKKFVVIAGLSVAALGVGGAAWAEANASTPTPTPTAAVSASSATTATTTAGRHDGREKAKQLRRELLKRAVHAQWVSKDAKTGAFVTHDAVRGVVTAVSASSVSVKAADGTTESFTVTSTTKVHAKGDSKAHPGTIGQVKVGDRVGVVGTGATTKTATHIVDRGAA